MLLRPRWPKPQGVWHLCEANVKRLADFVAVARACRLAVKQQVRVADREDCKRQLPCKHVLRVRLSLLARARTMLPFRHSWCCRRMKHEPQSVP